MKSNFEENIIYRWRFGLATLFGLTIVGFVLFVGLNNQPIGLSNAELQHLANIDGYGIVGDNLVNPIFRALQAASLKTIGLTEFGLRIPTAIAGLAAILAFYALLKGLYWRRLAFIGSFMLGTSSWFMHHSRIGDDAIFSALMITLFLLANWQLQRKKTLLWALTAAFIGGISLLTPFFLYSLIATVIALHKELRQFIKTANKKVLSVMGLSAASVLATFVYVALSDIEILQKLLNIPDKLPTISEYALNFIDVFSYIFWRSFEAPGFHLEQLPMLEVFTVAVVALGLFQFERNWRSARSRLLLAHIIVLGLAVGLQVSSQAMVVFMPFIYLLAAVGVSTLISQWQGVFPKNPIARTVGIAPIAILLVLVASYHYTRYFVAWQQHPATRIEFDQRPTLIYEELNNVNQAQKPTVIVVAKSELQRFNYLQTRYDWLSVRTFEQFKGSDVAKFIYAIPTETKSEPLNELLGEPQFVKVSEDTAEAVLYQRFEQ